MKHCKIARLFALVLAVALILSTMAGCASSEVRKVVSNFEQACQTMDTNGMLACLNPTITKPLIGLMSLVGVESLDGVMDLLVEVVDVIDFSDVPAEDVLKTLNIKCDDLAFNDAKNSCTVAATISFVFKGETKEQDVSIKCEIVDGEWYIMSFGG